MRNVFILIVIMMCCLPALLMPVTDKPQLGANEPPVPEVRLFVDGALNMNVLSDFTKYIEKYFVFRQELITLNSAVSAGIFNVSQVEDVVLGDEGWLYYSKTMDDYLHKNTLSGVEIDAIAETFQRIESLCGDKGIDFLLVVAPNKSSVYPQYMPYYGETLDESNNWEKLSSELSRRNVSHVDLLDCFRADEQVLYHKLDTHWNNLGAALACDEVLRALNHGEEGFRKRAHTETSDFDGDLYKMLYPKGKKKDANVKFSKAFTFTADEPIKSPEQFEIKTSNLGKTGSIVVFRDSFGNALYPFIAESFGKAVFTRVFSMDLLEKYDADTFMIVFAERNLAQLDRYISF